MQKLKSGEKLLKNTQARFKRSNWSKERVFLERDLIANIERKCDNRSLNMNLVLQVQVRKKTWMLR